MEASALLDYVRLIIISVRVSRIVRRTNPISCSVVSYYRDCLIQMPSVARSISREVFRRLNPTTVFTVNMVVTVTLMIMDTVRFRKRENRRQIAAVITVIKKEMVVGDGGTYMIITLEVHKSSAIAADLYASRWFFFPCCEQCLTIIS